MKRARYLVPGEVGVGGVRRRVSRGVNLIAPAMRSEPMCRSAAAQRAGCTKRDLLRHEGLELIVATERFALVPCVYKRRLNDSRCLRLGVPQSRACTREVATEL